MPKFTPSVSEIVKDQLYLGNLSAALSVEKLGQLSITHIVSVCPDYPSTGPKHLTIPVQDSELENLLIHLVEACCFIQNALEQGGRILLHCVMGISRSTTVLAAYLMKTRNMTGSNAIRFIQQRRPQANPNYGFVKQLDVFEKCGYEPSPSHPQYRSWKRRHAQDINNYFGHIVDTVAIIPNKLLMTSEFPDDLDQAHSLLLEMGVTHLLSISPAENASNFTSVMNHHHVNVNSQSPDALLPVLPSIGGYIRDAVKNEGSVVLVHCCNESRACTAICAYLMLEGRSYKHAFSMIQNVLPLFDPTETFLQNLERFQASLLKARPEYGVSSSSQRQSDPAGTPATKSSNILEQDEFKLATPSTIGGRGTDSAVFGDSTNLKTVTISVR